MMIIRSDNCAANIGQKCCIRGFNIKNMNKL